MLTMSFDPLPRAQPETLGLSSARLARIDQLLDAGISSGRIPGAVVAVARDGSLAYLKAFGFRDRAVGLPMTTDAIFSIASMTKPMVAVGALSLFEEGRLLLGDAVSHYLPELGAMPVALAGMQAADGAAIQTEPARRPMTVHDLMRHTSGLLYGGRGSSALHKRYPLSSATAAMNMTPAEFIDTLASLPLAYQPGTVWDYGLSMDVLGLVIEAVSGMNLGRCLRDRVFGPLKMTDTGYLVPADQAPRLARALPLDPETGKPQGMPDPTQALKFECGGSCAVSTAGDYLRFAQMLLNGGVLDGVRVLSRKTVEFMLADHLGPGVENRLATIEPQRDGYGFGLGVAVRRQTGVASTIGSAGDFFWNGAFGTSFWVDPKERLIAVVMMQAPGGADTRQRYRQAISACVMGALDR